MIRCAFWCAICVLMRHGINIYQDIQGDLQGIYIVQGIYREIYYVSDIMISYIKNQSVFMQYTELGEQKEAN